MIAWLVCVVAFLCLSVGGCDDSPTQVVSPGVNADHKPGHDNGNGGGKGDGGGGEPRVEWEAKVNRFTATDLAVAEGNGITFVLVAATCPMTFKMWSICGSWPTRETSAAVSPASLSDPRPRVPRQ